MKKRGKKRKCLYCQTLFTPDRYNDYHQQFCNGSDECKKVSHRAASQKIRDKHRNDIPWKEKENKRVKEWQKEHPDYWKTKKNAKIISSDSLLRDFAQAQNATSFPVLRDIVLYYSACLSGFIAHTGDWDEKLLLRDFIATVLNPLYDKGIALSSERNINLLKEEDYHDPEGNRKSRTPSAHAGGVRLGGSPPG